MRRHMAKIILLTVTVSGCQTGEDVVACEDAVSAAATARDDATELMETLRRQNAIAEAMPETVTPPGREFPDINPDRRRAEGQARETAQQATRAWERYVILVEQNPTCFDAEERANVEQISRRLPDGSQ